MLQQNFLHTLKKQEKRNVYKINKSYFKTFHILT